MANPSAGSTDIWIRRAEIGDADAVIRLTRATRAKLAAWSPVYFRSRVGADEGHGAFLQYVLGSPDHETMAIVEGETVIGFFQHVPQAAHLWVDDLSLDDRYSWADVANAIGEAIDESPWVTCVSARDQDRAEALVAIGLNVVSSYWARSLTIDDAADHVADGIGQTDGQWPRHTFGGMPFDPGLPGALVVGDSLGNFATGSPSVEPPIYDPGGPTTVIDRIGGGDRAKALDLAIGASASRSDAQLVVVCAADDDELISTLSDKGFANQVDVFLRAD